MDKVLLVFLSILLGFTILVVQFFLQSGGLKTIKIANKSPYYRPTFLICGPNNAGKTALFYKLLDDGSGIGEGGAGNEKDKGLKIVTTVSSIEPNFADITLPISNPQVGKKFQLVDYPGHLKYWNLFERLVRQDITLSQLKGVIIVIDSSSGNWGKDSLQVEKLTKFLYNLIAITERKQNGVDYMFALNKSDMFDALPVHKIRSTLELEIHKLIQNEISSREKTSGIDAIDDDAEDSVHGGGKGSGSSGGSGGGVGANGNGGVSRESLREFWLGVLGSAKGSTFTFDKLEGNMDFLNGSVLKGKIGSWEDWMDEKVVNP